MGVRQHLKIDRYGWDVCIYYTVDDAQKSEIMTKLFESGCDGSTLNSIKRSLEECRTDTGFTYSNYDSKCSILVIHKASNIGEFINTLEHERNHLEMHICDAMDINPYSEEASVMSGNIAQLILEKALCSIIML